MLKQISIFIRSLLFFIFTVTTISAYSILCVCSLPFPLRYRSGLIRAYLRFFIIVLKKLCHIDYHIEGLENIPKNQAVIIMSKHQSTWETFFLPTIFHDPAIILKRELLWIPFFGWGLAASDPIAINRQAGSSAMQQIITKGRKCLEEGRSILVFPEGTRIPAGQIGKFRRGGVVLAANTGYPIIPVAHNAGRFWPRRQFLKRPGTIQVVIGPLIPTQRRTPEEILRITQQWMVETMARIDG